MSRFSDARKNFLRVLRSSTLEPNLKKAFIEWAYGRHELINNKYSGLSQSIKQSFEFHLAVFELVSCLSTDSIERTAEAIEENSQPLVVAEKHPSSLDRPYDIVDKFSVLIHWEKSAKWSNLLSSHRIFIRDRQKCNKQCIIGFVCVMFRNDIFKKVCNLKPGLNKTITFRDVLEYCQERYNFGSLETGRKGLDHCIKMAFDRIPGLREFDENNYQKNNKQKNQLAFNKQRS